MSLLFWVWNGTVKTDAIDMSTGLVVHELRAASPVWFEELSSPEIVSSALAGRGIKNDFTYDANGNATLRADVEYKEFVQIANEILGYQGGY